MEADLPSFRVALDGAAFRVRAGDRERRYPLPAPDQQAWADLFVALAADFGTRAPRIRAHAPAPDPDAPVRPLLTEPVGRGILYGYGDPAVVRDEGGYHLVVTSNDAPDAFPILRSPDAVRWEHVGFAFPRGRTPGWAATGAHVADFWAPEIARVGGGWRLCYSARERSGALAIGLATAARPEGPWQDLGRPLITGGVIDPHLFVGPAGDAILYWKEDRNDRWPGLLAALLHADSSLVRALFPGEEDARTASLAAALWPRIRSFGPMERFFVLQPLIEAVVGAWGPVREVLRRHPAAGEILEAMRTPIRAQRMSTDATALVGEVVEVLENDLPWEGHLIEGPWVTAHAGRYWMFYAGNDFSTPEYGIGVAVADHPLGPWRKQPEPLLRSTPSWAGPGHPSVAPGPDGRPWIFFHAFRPGHAGYKEFRALLGAPLGFGPAGATVRGG